MGEIEKVLPKPRKNEKQDDFISRCMSNSEAKREFPEQAQRLAVCHSQWRRKNKDDIDDRLNELKDRMEDNKGENK